MALMGGGGGGGVVVDSYQGMDGWTVVGIIT